MELEFNKTVHPYLRCVVSEVKDQEQTGEIRLPDSAPDVGRVLCNWGQVIIRGKEWRGNGITVSGGVLVKVLYEPDGDANLQCVESWIPFQTKWDFGQSEKDGYIRVTPRLLGLDSRTASARKLIVCARIGINGKAMVSDSLQIPAAPELPPDVQVLKNSYPVLMPVEAGEKAFSVEEVIPMPAAKPVPEQLISYVVSPVLSESKLLGDKLVFRGTANLHIVYMDADNRLHSWNHEMPFSQYSQLDGEFDDSAEASLDFAVTGLEFECSEGEAYNCRVGIAAQYIIYNRAVTEIIEDVFSPARKILCTTEDVEIPAVLDRREMTLEADCQISMEINDMIDSVFYPGVPGSYTEDGEVYADLSGSFQVLGTDALGRLTASNGKWEKVFPLNTDSQTRTEMRFLPNGILEQQINGDSVLLRTQLPMEIVTMNRKPMSMITGIDLGDPVQQNPERPSVIIRRVGEDSLWKIAKDSGSSVELILKTNGLEGEPDPEQLLLVPVT